MGERNSVAVADDRDDLDDVVDEGLPVGAWASSARWTPTSCSTTVAAAIAT